MAMDVGPLFENVGDLPERTASPIAAGLKGSAILDIAGEVRGLIGAGVPVANFTIGDFDSKMFPVPEVLVERTEAHLKAGQTHYPPAIGVAELRTAIRTFYRDRLGLDYPEGTVQVGSGARPPIFSAFASILAPGDQVVYPVPSWNVGYYVYLNEAEGVPLVTRPENGFMPTLEDLLPHLKTARVLLLNSPLNPCGTVMDPALLKPVCEAIVEENARREAAGERPLILIYDQVYWQIVFEGYTHQTPVHMVPEMAKYTILVDAISKAWAGTGIRVGWAVAPPWIRDRMKALIGHMGAWAARAEQMATADLLAEPELVDPFMDGFKVELSDRLCALRDGFRAMRDRGCPVDCLDAQGAIYLSARLDLVGRTIRGREIKTDDDIRSVLLHEANVAVVPFSAFGYPDGTGWVRFSVGSVSMDDVQAALQNIERLFD